MPGEIDVDLCDKSLSNNYTVVVEINSFIAGFGDLDDAGYFDRFLLPDSPCFHCGSSATLNTIFPRV
ncbi:hypothetical protein MSWHS_2402 [Methanosarcina sp. WWM596]|nr:hypothetical protein MSWHS_2402 [Methanosarcina sp. WWM596]